MFCSNCGNKLEDNVNFCPICGTKVANALSASNTLTSISGTFTDYRDGKVYKTVKIGGQIWFAENLSYVAKDSKCYENNLDYCREYGRLYNWDTAMAACPPGWHLPAMEEWQILVDFVGGAKTAGMKLKAKNGWDSYDGVGDNGTDVFGFSALPGGNGSSNGNFNNICVSGYWWSANEYDNHYAYRQYMNYSYAGTLSNVNVKSSLFSVRCLKDYHD